MVDLQGLRSPEPFVACVTCGHFPCPCCGLGSCDTMVEPAPVTPEVQLARSAQARRGNAVTAVTLPVAANADVWCEQCNARLPRRKVPFHADTGKATLWFCSAKCVDSWIQDPGETDLCECGFHGRCTYGEGKEQNDRVETWFRAHMGTSGGSCGVDKDGWLTVYPPEKDA